MRCFSVSSPRTSTRRLSTIPRSRSPAAWDVAPKLRFSNNSSASPRAASGFEVPLPNPGGHAGLVSTASRFPHEMSSKTVPRSNIVPRAVHQNHDRETSRHTPQCYDVGRKTHPGPFRQRQRDRNPGYRDVPRGGSLMAKGASVREQDAGRIVGAGRGAQPPYLYPDYVATRLRAPKKPLIILPGTLSDTRGPALGRAPVGELDNDLTRQHRGEPLGERIIVTGRVLDGDGRPVRNSLIEIWQANAAGRYVHQG